ncbi:hypothetical protein VQL36_05455 [Chengkuizengella sp. SCS-71B]|uniref:hypothetical protein n=1 Tax=Chengkuizengella sp. SCS-71B TaxID=3115290 RepID=UPI0032C2421F
MIELFPSITEQDKEQTKFYLKKYPDMKSLMKDYEKHAVDMYQTDVEGETAKKESNEEYYSNKTANTVVFDEKRRLIYLEYKILTEAIERAVALIIDEEERKAMYYRHMRGYSYKEAMNFMPYSVSSKTFDRRLTEGLVSVTNTLKLWGVLEREWKY